MSVPPNSKEISKQLEFVKQQQQLRAIDMSSQSKQLSAESMIADLVYKKEIFQKRTPETLQKQEMPGWMSDRAVPPLYERVWLGVQGHSAGGLTDTPALSALLLTSGLPTETLGYIWSLANHTVPGALTQHELYLVLALVALAQTGYVVNNLTTLHQLPQAPVPTLDLSQLPTQVSTPTPVQSSYPSLLSVASLPDPPTPTPNYSWVAPTQSSTDQIGISYVSSALRPVISLTDSSVPNTGNLNNSSSNLLLNVNDKKKNNNSQKYLNNLSFSFPKLSESPSHVAKATFTSDSDPIDDEFTEFQSADFSPNSQLKAKILKENSSSVVTDEDEFSNFQTALPNYNSDDLSVLVVDGRNISSAHQLWVADNSSLTDEHETSGQVDGETKTKYIDQQVKFEDDNSFIEFDSTKNIKNHSANKYDVFQEIADDTFSVFHNPLSDDEDKLSIVSGNAIEGLYAEAKSIFHNSLLEDADISDSFQLRNLPQVLDKLDKNSVVEDLKSETEEDEEFDNFQTFPVTFQDNEPTHSTDKYDVFRTIVFEATSSDLSTKQVTLKKGAEEIWKNDQFVQDEKDLFSIKESILFNKFPAVQDTDNITISNFEESLIITQKENSNLNNLFSSLEISEKNNMDTKLGEGEDKYKALRLLEYGANETDEFGDFLGAEFPNTESDPQCSEEQPSIQIRCLEACLNLLKTGLAILSKASSQEVVSEILGDSRGNTYLDCLLEVHRVSERIIAHLNCDLPLTAELRQTWHAIEPYFTQSNHHPLAMTVGAMCGVCRSNTGPSSVTFGALSFHAPCANLYLHCVEPVLPNSSSGVYIQ